MLLTVTAGLRTQCPMNKRVAKRTASNLGIRLGSMLLFILPEYLEKKVPAVSSTTMLLYAPQTKILEGRTNDWLLNGS